MKMYVNVFVLDHSEEAQAFKYWIRHEMQNVELGGELNAHLFQSLSNRLFCYYGK